MKIFLSLLLACGVLFSSCQWDCEIAGHSKEPISGNKMTTSSENSTSLNDAGISKDDDSYKVEEAGK